MQVTGKTVQEIYNAGSNKTHHINWCVRSEAVAPDGVMREMVLVNGEFPGPTIRAKRGDVLKIHVQNDLAAFNQSTSIHFHGLFQRGMNAMDGVPGVTQCGIPAGEDFCYVFDLTQSGTFWWHSHSRLQRIDGMFGGLIVYDPEEAYVLGRDYDEEIFIVLHDHYYDLGDANMNWYLSKESAGFEPVPNNVLINGQGVTECDRIPNRYSCKRGRPRLPKFQFERGRKYRLRILNASAFAEIDFSIDDHVLNIIEVDSTEVEEFSMHSIAISPGQRYSVIVEADSNFESVYMRANMQNTCFQYRPYGYRSDLSIVVEYSSSLTTAFTQMARLLFRRWMPPTGTLSSRWSDVLPPDECVDLDVVSLKPKIAVPAPEPDVRYVISPKTMQFDRMHLAPFAFVNRTSFLPAIGAPNLHVALGLVNASDTVPVPTVSGRQNTAHWGGDQLVTEIPLGNVVELIINNDDDSAHPFHLHGHDFAILRVYAETKAGIGKWRPEYVSSYVLDNPLRRDVVTIPKLGHAVIRFRADNPGVWAFHCHISWHLAAGMMMQFAVGVSTIDHSGVTNQMLEHCAMERDLGTKLLRPLPGDEMRKDHRTA
ncbi:Cupredoxin [Lipomyces kononenkoae]|uniref:Cupredoxin n=1 Tax=Lipomyces kononenkoae TaxID=34357 RepID=A0ACC3SY02_LIPKO